MPTSFNNKASHLLFIGQRSLAEVIAQDEKELLELNGNFEAIANRMQSISDIARGVKVYPRDFDNKVTILNYITYRGMQECPFDISCRIEGYTGWNEDVVIKSKLTERRLIINPGTAHLARQHHLLEKDNAYGISAREFYASFM